MQEMSAELMPLSLDILSLVTTCSRNLSISSMRPVLAQAAFELESREQMPQLSINLIQRLVPYTLSALAKSVSDRREKCPRRGREVAPETSPRFIIERTERVGRNVPRQRLKQLLCFSPITASPFRNGSIHQPLVAELDGQYRSGNTSSTMLFSDQVPRLFVFHCSLTLCDGK